MDGYITYKWKDNEGKELNGKIEITDLLDFQGEYYIYEGMFWKLHFRRVYFVINDFVYFPDSISLFVAIGK